MSVIQEWSEDESEEEESQQPISREDSGIQVDRTPQEDQEQNDKMVPVTWAGERTLLSGRAVNTAVWIGSLSAACVIVGELDARSWLELHVVTPYWVPHSSRFPHSLHLHSNLLNVW